LTAERRVDRLIVGGIKLDLIHIHPDARAFLVRKRSNPAFFRERRRCCHGDRRACRA
jgi:hypothetical protein